MGFQAMPPKHVTVLLQFHGFVGCAAATAIRLARMGVEPTLPSSSGNHPLHELNVPEYRRAKKAVALLVGLEPTSIHACRSTMLNYRSDHTLIDSLLSVLAVTDQHGSVCRNRTCNLREYPVCNPLHHHGSDHEHWTTYRPISASLLPNVRSVAESGFEPPIP